MAPSGPLPTGEAIRRNKPTIPTTKLPASGRSTPTPPVPTHYRLRDRGTDWWEWAWHTPQACGWDDGALFAVARRAQLEDDLSALDGGDFDLSELIADDDPRRAVQDVIAGLKALAGGRLSVLREIRELDDRLGLTPKGLAALRWSIIEGEESSGKEPAPAPKSRRLKAV